MKLGGTLVHRYSCNDVFKARCPFQVAKAYAKLVKLAATYSKIYLESIKSSYNRIQFPNLLKNRKS